MAISLRTAGTATAANVAVTAVNPAVPTGTTTGDLSVLTVWMKPFGTTITTPSGWTKIGEYSNGTTAAGTDTGSTKVAVFVKESAAVGAIGNLTLDGSPNSVGAVINTYQKGASESWDYSAWTSGGDAANGANYSATGAAGISVASGDWVCQSTAVNGDVGTQSAQAIGGMSGATIGTYVVRQSSDTTTGTDSHGEVGDVPISAGSSTAAPTFTYTNASSGSGSTIWLRLRVVALTAVSNAISTSWHVNSIISKAIATSWHVNAIVSKALSTLWNVAEGVPVSRAMSTSWHVYSIISQSRSTAWHVLKEIAAARSTTWNVRTVISQSRSTLWNVTVSVSKALSTSWHSRAYITKALSTTWNVRSVIAQSKSTLWNSREYVTKSASTLWNVNAYVTQAVSTLWNILEPTVSVLKSVSTTWNSLELTSQVRSTLWNVYEEVVHAWSTFWNIQDLTAPIWYEWNGAVLTKLTEEGVWNGTAVEPVVRWTGETYNRTV